MGKTTDKAMISHTQAANALALAIQGQATMGATTRDQQAAMLEAYMLTGYGTNGVNGNWYLPGDPGKTPMVPEVAAWEFWKHFATSQERYAAASGKSLAEIVKPWAPVPVLSDLSNVSAWKGYVLACQAALIAIQAAAFGGQAAIDPWNTGIPAETTPGGGGPAIPPAKPAQSETAESSSLWVPLGIAAAFFALLFATGGKGK